MECIVTAGPTYEPLDQARRITNFSTGRLGCELAGYLSSLGHTVHLLLGEQATWHGPTGKSVVSRFSTGADLASRIKALASDRISAVFHAAAVADFRPAAIFRRGPQGVLEPISAGKISTSGGSILVELEPTPKILGSLRGWYPDALIVGWKYEVDGTRENTLALAARQVKEHGTDACVANGPAYGPGFGLVLPDGSVKAALDRKEILEYLAGLI